MINASTAHTVQQLTYLQITRNITRTKQTHIRQNDSDTYTHTNTHHAILSSAILCRPTHACTSLPHQIGASQLSHFPFVSYWNKKQQDILAGPLRFPYVHPSPWVALIFFILHHHRAWQNHLIRWMVWIKIKQFCGVQWLHSTVLWWKTFSVSHINTYLWPKHHCTSTHGGYTKSISIRHTINLNK